MKIWTWERCKQELRKHPDLKRKFDDYPPRKYLATFEEVFHIDEEQIDILAKVIGCRNAISIKAQQQEVMNLRKITWKTPREWIEAVTKRTASDDTEDYDDSLEKITRQYGREKKCHRNLFGPRAGIRCYCK